MATVSSADWTGLSFLPPLNSFDPLRLFEEVTR